MNGLRRETTEKRDLMTNQGVIESALDELLYRPRYPATVLVPAAGAAFGNVSSAAYLAYPKAGTPAGRVSLPTPPRYWEKGSMGIRIIWSGDTASAVTNVQWQVNMTLTALGGVPTVITGPQPAVPGPSVVNALQDYTFQTAGFWPVDASIISVGINIFRNGGSAADTYVGEARLFGFQVIYTPSAGH